MREQGVDFPDPGRAAGPVKVGGDSDAGGAARGRAGVRGVPQGHRAAGALRGAAAGVQGGRAGPRALHARARDRLPRPDVLRGRRRADPARRAAGSTPRTPTSRRPRRSARASSGRDHGAAAVRPRAVLARRGAGRRRMVAAGRRRAGRRRRERRPRPRRRRRGRDRRRSSARDLVERDELDGTLGYAGAGSAPRGRRRDDHRGCARPAPSCGAGEALYWLDGAPAAFLLYGRLPAWRDFGAGDRRTATTCASSSATCARSATTPTATSTVDDEWDWATTAAVRRFQDARGLAEDGTLARGELALPARARRGSARPRRRSARRPRPGASWRRSPRPSGA